MAQLENIEAIEKRLWGSADNLRANSNYASNEYFMPVMGLIFQLVPTVLRGNAYGSRGSHAGAWEPEKPENKRQ